MSYFNQLNKFPPLIQESQIQLDVTQLISDMNDKQATLQQWENLSYCLFKFKRFNDFLAIIKYVTDYVINKYHDEESKPIKIRIYNSLSIYYLIQATKQEGFDKATDHFDNVVKNFNLSDKYDFVGHTFNIKGLYSFFRGEKDQTLNYYKTSIDDTSQKDAVSVTSCIGIAQVYFAIGNYKDSLQYFKKAIKLNPNIPGRARLGLAYCYYSLGNYALAYHAFNRAFMLEPTNVEAHLGLAVLAYDRGEYDKYFKWLCLAYKLEPNNSVVLYYLGEHYFYKQEYERAQKCLKQGVKSLDQVNRFQIKEKNQEDQFRNDWNQLKSRYLYMLGLLKQIEGDFDQAFKYYNQAKHLNRNNMLVLQGLSQIYLHNQSLNYNESYKLSEKLLKSYESTQFVHELYKQIAYVQSKNILNRRFVFETYRKALRYNSEDSEVLIEYAQQLENEEAAQYYSQAERILANKQNNQKFHQLFQKQTDYIIFPELYINMGVHSMNSDPQLSLKSYEKCQEILQDFQIPEYVVETSEDASKQEAHLKKNVYSVILYFNKGILMEQQIGDYVTALELYKECIKINPYFIDSYVRMAYLQHCLGDSQTAIRNLQDAKIYLEQIVNHNRNFKTLNPIPSIYGFISYELFDEVVAKDQFKQIQEDCYSKIFLMSYDYQMAADKNKNDDQSFLKDVLKTIAKNAMKILQHDPKNLQASMILILIMAEWGRVQEALGLLENLQEYSNLQPRIYSNLAILEAKLQTEENYQSAKLYFKKFHEKTNYKQDDHNDVAQAQMHLNYRNYKEASNTIKRQILNNPGQMKHRLNLNMIIHQQCYEILEEQAANYTQLNQAVTYFKCLLRSYEYMAKPQCWYSREQHYLPHLRQIIRSNQIQILRSKSDDRFNFINSFQNNFDKLLKEAEEKEKWNKQLQEEREKQRREKLIQMSQKNQQIVEEEYIDEARIQEMALLAEQFRADIIKQQELEKIVEQKNKGKSKSSKKKQLQNELLNTKLEDEQFLDSDGIDESYGSKEAQLDEFQVKMEIGQDSEKEFEEQEQYEQRQKQKKKKNKKKQKEKKKQKSRLVKQSDSIEDKVYESDEYENIF